MRSLIFALFLFSQTFNYADDLDFLTIEKALDLASEHNPKLNQVRQEVNAIKAEWWFSTGLENPELVFMKEGIDVNAKGGFEERRWTISQSFKFPLTSYYTLQAINNRIKSKQEKLKAESIRLKAEVKSKYADLIYQNEILELRQKQLQLADQLKNSALTRFEVGEASELELLKAELQYAEAENDRALAEQHLNNARFGFLAVIGINPENQQTSISLPDSMAYTAIEINERSVIEQVEQQPEMLQMIYMEKFGRASLRSAWSNILPDVELNYYRQDFGEGYDHYGYEIGLNIPLWFFLNQKGQIQKARAMNKELFWRKNEKSLTLKRNIEIAWNGFQKAKIRIEKYKFVIRERAIKLRDLTLEGYQAGEISLLELLEAQRTFLSNEQRYLDALHDYYLKIIELEKYVQREMILHSGSTG